MAAYAAQGKGLIKWLGMCVLCISAEVHAHQHIYDHWVTRAIGASLIPCSAKVLWAALFSVPHAH